MADHSNNHLSVSLSQAEQAGAELLPESASNSKSLVRGNSVATLNQIYQHHNSIPVRNRILNTAKSLYSSVEAPNLPDSLPDDTILLPAGGTSAQRYALSPADLAAKSGSALGSRVGLSLSQQQQQAALQLRTSVQHSSRSVQPQSQPNQLASSPIRIINVARRHKKQQSAYVAYATGVQSAQAQFQAQTEQCRQSQGQSQVSPRRSKLAAWSSSSSSCSSSRDPSPSQTNSFQFRSSPARQLDVVQQQQPKQKQQVAMTRSSSPSPTTSRASQGQLGPPQVDSSSSSSQPTQQQSPSPRRRVLPKIGNTPNQQQSFALDRDTTTSVQQQQQQQQQHQRRTYLESGSAEPAGQAELVLQQTSPSSGSSVKRHRKLPQIPIQASFQQALADTTGSTQAQIGEAAIGGPPALSPSIPLRRSAPNKSLSSSSSASSNSPLFGDLQRPPVVQQVVPQTQTQAQQQALNPSANQSSRQQSHNSPGVEQLRFLSFPTPSESQTTHQHQQQQQQPTSSSGLASQLARANTLVHPPTLANRPALSEQRSFGTPNQLVTQQQSTGANKSLDSSPPSQLTAPVSLSGFKQVGARQQRAANSSSPSSNSPMANKSPSYLMASSEQALKMSKYFTFDQQQPASCETTQPTGALQSSPFRRHAPQEQATHMTRLMAAESQQQQLDQQLNVPAQSGGQQQQQQASQQQAGRGRRLSTCGSGLRANFLMNKQHAISEFTPPRSLESSTSRGSTDAGAGVVAGNPNATMQVCTGADGSLALHSGARSATPTLYAPQELMAVGPDWTMSFSPSPGTAQPSLVATNANANANQATRTDSLAAGSLKGVAGGNRSSSVQNIRSCGALTSASGTFMTSNSTMIANSSLAVSGKVGAEGIMSSSNSELPPSEQQQQQRQISIRGANSGSICDIGSNTQADTGGYLLGQSRPGCPIVSIGQFTSVASYGRRPSGVLSGLPPRAASATEASSLQLQDAPGLAQATSSNLAPNANSHSNFHANLSANVKLAPTARSMIMSTSSSASNYVASNGAGTRVESDSSANLRQAQAGATTSANSNSSSTSASKGATNSNSNFAETRRLLPWLSCNNNNTLSIDVYHHGNEEAAFGPSTQAPTGTGSLAPPLGSGPAKQWKRAGSGQDSTIGQYEQRTSLGLPPTSRDRQLSNVSTNSMPAGSFVSQARSSCSPTVADNSLSQASSGEAQKARKFGAWAERIATSNSGNQAPGRARSASQLESPAGSGQLGRSISGGPASSSSEDLRGAAESGADASSLARSGSDHASSSSSSRWNSNTSADQAEMQQSNGRHKTVLVGRRQRRQHKYRRRHEEGSVSVEDRDTDQLTLADRLKLAERSANELFRKVELSPQSQLKQSSADSGSTSAFFSHANLGHSKSRGNSSEEPQQNYLQAGSLATAHNNNNKNNKIKNKNANEGDEASLFAPDCSWPIFGPSGGGESHEFADDEQGDDLSLFLRSVDKQRLKQLQLGHQQQYQTHRHRQEPGNKLVPSNKLALNTSGIENNTSSTTSSTRLNKQTSKFMRSVRGSLRLRHNNGSLASNSRQFAEDQGARSDTCAANNEANIRLRAAKVVRRAITFRSLAKTFSWRASSCEQRSREHLPEQATGSSSTTAAESEPATDSQHAHLLATAGSASAAITSSVAGRGRAGEGLGTPPHDPQPQWSEEPKRTSAGQWILQAAANPFGSFQRPSLSGVGRAYGLRTGTRGSQGRKSSSVEVDSESGNLSGMCAENIVRAGSYSAPVTADYMLQQQRQGTTSAKQQHRSLGRMKSVITSVSRRLETLRLMRGKQAHSDDSSVAQNYSDNPADIRYHTGNLFRRNQDDHDDNLEEPKQNNNFEQRFRPD